MINQQQQIQAVRISRLVFVLESVQEKYAADVGLRVLIYRCARDAMQVCECAAERPRRFPEERISRSFYTLDTHAGLFSPTVAGVQVFSINTFRHAVGIDGFRRSGAA